MESTPINVPILWLSTVISKGSGSSTDYESTAATAAAQDLSSDPRLSFVLSWLGGTETETLTGSQQGQPQSAASQNTAAILKEITCRHFPAKCEYNSPLRFIGKLFSIPFFLLCQPSL